METEPILLTNRYVAGPYPYLPGKKLFKAFLKVQAQYEHASPVRKPRLLKKAESLMLRFKKETGFEMPS